MDPGGASARRWLITTEGQVQLLNPGLVWPGTPTWQSDQVESLVIVGSTPTSATYPPGMSEVGSKDRLEERADCRLPSAHSPAKWSRGPAATTPVSQTGND